MPQSPDWNKYLDAGAEFVAMTRAQARQRAKVLVGTGQLAQEQVQGFVDELVDESRRRTDLMLDVVRKEIQRQVKTLGIATKEDLARLEARIVTQTNGGAKSGSKPAAKSARSKPKSKPAKAAKKKPAASKQAKPTKPAKATKPAKQKAQPAKAKKRSGQSAAKAAAS
jgi:polyhydroxyalkanoate synthesis regulator phasin